MTIREMTRDQLRGRARDLGAQDVNRLSKAKLIAWIEAKESEPVAAGEVVKTLPVQLVGDAYLQAGQYIEDIETGNHHPGQAVNPAGKTGGDGVEPAAAARPPRGAGSERYVLRLLHGHADGCGQDKRRDLLVRALRVVCLFRRLIGE